MCLSHWYLDYLSMLVFKYLYIMCYEIWHLEFTIITGPISWNPQQAGSHKSYVKGPVGSAVVNSQSSDQPANPPALMPDIEWKHLLVTLVHCPGVSITPGQSSLTRCHPRDRGGRTYTTLWPTESVNTMKWWWFYVTALWGGLIDSNT